MIAAIAIDIAKKVRAVLAETYPGAVINVDRFYGAKRVNGQILWDSFEGMSTEERQNHLYDTLDAKLGEDRRGVSIILAYTPREWELMGEE